MATLTLASLLIQETKTAIYETALKVAENIGLAVTSWQEGDPTRSLYHLEAEVLSALEKLAAGFISSAYPEYAEDENWLVIGAKQGFNVDVPEATFAATDIVFTNNGGGNYPFEIGELTVKSTLTGKTFRNTESGLLPPWVPPAVKPTVTIAFEADEAGSASSAGASELTEIVTSMLGVTCTNPTAAIGVDRPTKAEILKLIEEKTGSLSPLGPKEIYSFVAKRFDLTGTRAVTRTRVYDSSESGDVTMYLAGPSGPVAEPDRALVEAACLKWAVGLCQTPTILSSSNVTVTPTYEMWVYKSVNKTTAEVQADVLKALQTMIAAHPIGGDFLEPEDATGVLAHSKIEATIKNTYAQVFKVSLTLPAGDVAIGNGQVAALGVVTAVINFLEDPR